MKHFERNWRVWLIRIIVGILLFAAMYIVIPVP